MEVTQAHKKALSKAKIGLMTAPDAVFFSSICMALDHHFDDSIPTACTNYKTVKYNPTFFMSHTPAQRIGLVLHETLHVALKHNLRQGTRTDQRWNGAADYAINNMVLSAGFELPPGGLVNREWSALSSEAIYKLLPEDFEMPEGMGDLSKPSQGDGTGEAVAADLLAQEEEVNSIILQASMTSQSMGNNAGKLPGEFQLLLSELTKPTINWWSVLSRFIVKLSKVDYTFKKPNRRYLPHFILPTAYSEKVEDPAIMLDMSCSVTDDEVRACVSNAAGIFQQLKPDFIQIVQFDTQIKSAHKVRNVRELKDLEFKGRGGTRIAPVMEWIANNKPAVALVFSDGYFEKPINPKVPVIWLIHHNPEFTAPFGKVIHYTI